MPLEAATESRLDLLTSLGLNLQLDVFTLVYLIELINVNSSVSEVLTAAHALLHWTKSLLAGFPGTVAR